MATIEQNFWEFHKANPMVYYELLSKANQLHAQGYRRLSIKMLFESVRFDHMVKVRRDRSGFKLNNNYTPYYARLIMERNLDLRDIFETRQQGVNVKY